MEVIPDSGWALPHLQGPLLGRLNVNYSFQKNKNKNKIYIYNNNKKIINN